MFGRTWGVASQASDFFWDGPPAQTSQAALPAKSGKMATAWTQAVGLPLVPQSRSGPAALAQLVSGGAAASDPFSFDDTPPVNNQAVPLQQNQKRTTASGGWQGRSNSFLLGGVPPPPPQRGQQQPQPQCAARHAAQPAAPPRIPSQLPATAAWPSSAAVGTTFKPTAVVGAAAMPASATTGANPAFAASAAGPPISVSISLERYLEFWQLLSKGSGQVQMLSDLEKSILKAADLKQILLVNGLNSGSRPKKELLDKLSQMRLFTPLCLQHASAGSGCTAEGGIAAVAQCLGSHVSLDADALASLDSLGWVLSAAAGHKAEACSSSCCTLPTVRIVLQDAEQAGMPAVAAMAQAGELPRQHHPQQEPGVPDAQDPRPLLLAQPADSDVTVASLQAVAACADKQVQCSPGVVKQHTQVLNPAAQGEQAPAALVELLPRAGYGGRSNKEHPACEAETEEAGQLEGREGEEDVPQPPEWLVQGVARVAERSQGSQDTVSSATELQGRRVCFVLLADFEQGDPAGITDTLEAGVQEGRVMEPVGVAHDDDCPPGCTQHHAFHYVRVRASRSTAAPAKRAGRRLDLVVDLQEAHRQPQLDCLLCMGDAELQDAWVLLEPRQEDERAEDAHDQATAAAVKAAAVAAARTQLPANAAPACASKPWVRSSSSSMRTGMPPLATVAGAATPQRAVPHAVAGTASNGWRTKRESQWASIATAPAAKRQQTAGWPQQ